MKRLHCILNEPTALSNVIKLVEQKTYDLIAQNKSARIENVYAAIRKDGIEIDTESVSYAASQLGQLIGTKQTSTLQEINDFGGAGMKKLIDSFNTKQLKETKLGQDPIDLSVAKSLVGTFNNLIGNAPVEQKTRIVELRDALMAQAKSMVAKPVVQPKVPESFDTILKRAFALENTQQTVDDSMQNYSSVSNKLDTVWDKVKGRISEIAQSIPDPTQKQVFLEMVDAIQNSSYTVLLSSKDADNVIKDVLTKAGYTKELIKDGVKKTVIDWNKAMRIGDDWQQVFYDSFKKAGFSDNETDRIIQRIEGAYTQLINKKAQGMLSSISDKLGNQQNEKSQQAIERLLQLRNAGAFDANNRGVLYQALGININDGAAQKIKDILDSYKANTKFTGNISNVEAEEVHRAINNILQGVDKNVAKGILNGLNDYMLIKNATIISTAFNTFQNATSGFMQTFLLATGVMAKNRNLSIGGRFFKSFMTSFWDVVKGGVVLRDGSTINVMELVQGRGGLSDRYNFQVAMQHSPTSIKGLWERTKALITLIPQISATAFDTANSAVMYEALNYNNAVRILAQKEGIKRGEARNKINKQLFNSANRSKWVAEAKSRLDKQIGVSNAKSKVSRIADELQYMELVEHFAFTLDEIKALQSSSIDQKTRNLGQQSDIGLMPLSNMARTAATSAAAKAKKENDKTGYYMNSLMANVINYTNLFVGGQFNWLVLALQSTPLGLGQVLTDLAISKMVSGEKRPLFAQPLDFENSENLKKQLEARNKINGRIMRSVAGTFVGGIAGTLYMTMIAADDDDDEERRMAMYNEFADEMKDPVKRRFLDKFLPMGLAAEISYAWDKKKKEFDPEKISNSAIPYLAAIPEYIKNPFNFAEYVGKVQLQGTLDRFSEQKGIIEKIYKNDPELREQKTSVLLGRTVGEFLQLPYTTWWKVEKGEFRLYKNDFKADMEAAAAEKQAYIDEVNNLEGFWDGAAYGSSFNLFGKLMDDED